MSRMPWWPVSSIIRFVGIVGCVAALTSCSSRHTVDSIDQMPTSITLERKIHFIDSQGESTPVSPGTYEVSTDGRNLDLTGGIGNELIRLEAQKTTHEQAVNTTTPLSFSEREDEHVIMLLFSDGTALETVGSYSGIQSRATRKRYRKTPQAVIKRQFHRLALANRARLTIQSHFTLRVPVQLNNLSSDINQVKIRCWTYSGVDATRHERRIGEGESIANVVNRKFNGTIVVRFNASRGKEPEDADRYNCSMFFHKPGIGFRQPGKFGTSLGNQKPAWLVSAEGTPFRIHWQGGVNS